MSQETESPKGVFTAKMCGVCGTTDSTDGDWYLVCGACRWNIRAALTGSGEPLMKKWRDLHDALPEERKAKVEAEFQRLLAEVEAGEPRLRDYERILRDLAINYSSGDDVKSCGCDFVCQCAVEEAGKLFREGKLTLSASEPQKPERPRAASGE